MFQGEVEVVPANRRETGPRYKYMFTANECRLVCISTCWYDNMRHIWHQKYQYLSLTQHYHKDGGFGNEADGSSLREMESDATVWSFCLETLFQIFAFVLPVPKYLFFFFFSISEKGERNNPCLVVLDMNCTLTNDSGSQVDTTETAKNPAHTGRMSDSMKGAFVKSQLSFK